MAVPAWASAWTKVARASSQVDGPDGVAMSTFQVPGRHSGHGFSCQLNHDDVAWNGACCSIS